MRALLQRSRAASVQIDGQVVGEIEHGLVVFLGLSKTDDYAKGVKLIDKILKYRMFEDEQGKMGANIQQVQGQILWVSQFTLYGKTDKGLRPDFSLAMPPTQARVLYDQLVDYLKSQHSAVATGIFAADMQVHLINDGPVTFLLEVD